MKTTIPFSIVLVFLSVTLAPQARATCQEGCDTTNGSTFLGDGALVNNTNIDNTATGAGALSLNTMGGYNTANGFNALLSNTYGYENTANGALALYSNTTGFINTAIGYNALYGNTTGIDNTATGVFALYSNTIGNYNTANGFSALSNNTAGYKNTALGWEGLLNNSTGAFNVAVGYRAGTGIVHANNVIAIGAAGADVSNRCYIGQIFGVTSSGGTAVFINSNGQLGTVTSSGRFKEQIKPMDKASEALLVLKPVTFRYKKGIDPEGTAQFGLVAEEVEKVNPDLIVRDKEGKPYSVRYEAVNAMLLNEFLKEHRTVQELKSIAAKQEANAAKQEATIAQQQKQIEALTAGLQKVSAQL